MPFINPASSAFGTSGNPTRSAHAAITSDIPTTTTAAAETFCKSWLQSLPYIDDLTESIERRSTSYFQSRRTGVTLVRLLRPRFARVPDRRVGEASATCAARDRSPRSSCHTGNPVWRVGSPNAPARSRRRGARRGVNITPIRRPTSSRRAGTPTTLATVPPTTLRFRCACLSEISVVVRGVTRADSRSTMIR